VSRVEIFKRVLRGLWRRPYAALGPSVRYESVLSEPASSVQDFEDVARRWLVTDRDRFNVYHKIFMNSAKLRQT
jgi:hypothetical protein